MKPISNAQRKRNFGGPRHPAYRILVPRPGIEPRIPAVEARSLNHWTTREYPGEQIFKTRIKILLNRLGWYMRNTVIPRA